MAAHDVHRISRSPGPVANTERTGPALTTLNRSSRNRPEGKSTPMNTMMIPTPMTAPEAAAERPLPTGPAWADASAIDGAFVPLGEVIYTHTRNASVTPHEGADGEPVPVRVQLRQHESLDLGDRQATLHPAFIQLDDEPADADDEPRIAAVFSIAEARTLALALLELADAHDAAAPLT